MGERSLIGEVALETVTRPFEDRRAYLEDVIAVFVGALRVEFPHLSEGELAIRSLAFCRSVLARVSEIESSGGANPGRA